MPSPTTLAACLAAVALLGATPSARVPVVGAPGTAVASVTAAQVAQLVAPDLRTSADAIGAYGGLTRALVATDDALYMAQGHRIETADLADPEQPRFVASHAFTDTVAALAIAQGHLLAAVGDRLVVLDLADPLRPTPVAEVALTGPGTLLEADPSGALLYAAHDRWDEPAGVDLVELAAPGAPRLAGHIDLASRAEDLAAGDGTLYVASFAGLGVFDVRDPSAPIDVGLPGDWDGPTCCVARIALAGGALYAVHNLRRRGITMVSAIELPNPLQPRYRGGTGTNTYEVRDLIVHDGWLLKSSISLDRLTSRLSVLGGSSGEYDLGWEAKATLYGHVTALAAYGDHVYGATYGCGLTTFRWQPQGFPTGDVADLPVAGVLPIGGPISAVVVQGTDVMVMGSPRDACNRIDRLELSDPAAPKLRSLIPLPGRPEVMAKTADGAAIALHDAKTNQYALRLVQGPAGAESLTSPIEGCGEPYALAFDAATDDLLAAGSTVRGSESLVASRLRRGDLACQATTGLGLDHVAAIGADGGRLATIGAPSGSHESSGELWLFADGGRAPQGTASLEIIGDQSYAMAVAGPAVYVAGAGLNVFDISNPASPRLAQDIASSVAYGGTAAIDVAGSHAAVVDGDITLYEASDRLAVRPIIRWHFGPRPEDVAILGAHVLVAAGDAGLLVLPMLPAGWRAEHSVFVPAVMAGP